MLRNAIQRQPVLTCSVVLIILIGVNTASAQPDKTTVASKNEQPLVRTNRAQLTLAGAERAIIASRRQAGAMSVQVNIAVVDDGGHLLAFARMDGARPGSVYTSITKATSAATKRGPTGPLPNSDAVNTHLSLAVENAAAVSGGKFTTLKGGIPIIYDGQVIGAIGVGGATGEQDAEVAAAGIAELAKSFESVINSQSSTEERSLFGKWLIEDIEGRGVIDNAQTTIQIAEDGSVTGNTGVNRFIAKAKLGSLNIEFEERPVTTRAAGPPALMDQESNFLIALQKTKKYHIDGKGLLHLVDRKGKTVLRASTVE
ncbi:heme-binding protein [uncultured Gimesia sp.]|uniref:heme-binding protein n=1 Tax=uncultured Gimesia sp. TaxID=1678688 RepID=UPI0030DBCDC9|tara:strand:+ start:1897 stop:2838 length:942 start_codon:yes stop_codon:yes gene_type:complete